MTRLLSFFLCFAALSSVALASERKPLVSLREDFSGHGMRTHEIKLAIDGTIVDEKYDFYMGPEDAWHTVTIVRRVKKRDIQAIVDRASELMKALPQVVDAQRPIELDPESKQIRVVVNGIELFSGWAAYKNAPPSAESKSFQDVWQSLQSLLTSPGA